MNTGKILVLGASGQVASCLKAISREHFVFVGRPAVDMSNKSQLLSLIDYVKPRLIINTAAYTKVDLAEKETKLAYLINGESVKHLSIKCALANIPLIHLSTDYVFDGSKTTAYLETDSPNPLSVYGKSKLAGEQYIKHYLKNYIILRSSWLFSHYGMNFVKNMLKLATNNNQINVVNDQRGLPTSGINLAKVIIKISEQILDAKQHVSYGTYHYGDYPAVTWYEFASHIFKILEQKHHKSPVLRAITTDQYKALAIRPINSTLNCALISKNFQIKPGNWLVELTKCLTHLI